MISFIVIGKNEGWKLTLCLNSIRSVVSELKLKRYEIVYVDSASEDDSLKRAALYDDVKVIRLTATCNAAIARNVGVFETAGDTLLFVDGDMELRQGFLGLVYNEEEGLMESYVTGTVVDLIYDHNWDRIGNETVTRVVSSSKNHSKTGGIFLINRTHWEAVGGMDNTMRRSQDVELGLRLTQMGVTPARKAEIIAFHHTIPYDNQKRMWRMLFSGAELYRAVTLRKNLFNIAAWRFFIRTNYTTLILIASIIAGLISGLPLLIIIYPLSLLTRKAAKGILPVSKFALRFIYTLITDLSLPFAFLLFFPTKKEVKYEVISKGKRTA